MPSPPPDPGLAQGGHVEAPLVDLGARPGGHGHHRAAPVGDQAGQGQPHRAEPLDRHPAPLDGQPGGFRRSAGAQGDQEVGRAGSVPVLAQPGRSRVLRPQRGEVVLAHPTAGVEEQGATLGPGGELLHGGGDGLGPPVGRRVHPQLGAPGTDAETGEGIGDRAGHVGCSTLQIDGALRARPTETGASSRSRTRNPLVDVSLTVCTARIVGGAPPASPPSTRAGRPVGPGPQRRFSAAIWEKRVATSARGGGGVELPVGGRHVHRDAFVVAQVGEGPEVDVPGGVGGRHAAVEALAGLPVHVLEVGLHRLWPGGVGEGAVSGDDGVELHAQQQVAGPHPVGERPGPDDRGTRHEQDVPRVTGPAVGQVDEHVAPGVRRPHLDELHPLTGGFQLHPAGERRGGQGRRDALEVEGTEAFPYVGAQLGPEVGRLHGGQHLGRHVAHLLGRRLGGDDVGPFHQLVAVAVVAVGVGVDQRADGRAAGQPAHRVEHRGRQVQVEQRVDQQRFALTHDQAGIGPPPAPVGLQVGEAAVGHLEEALRIVPVVDEQLGGGHGSPYGSRCGLTTPKTPTTPEAIAGRRGPGPPTMPLSLRPPRCADGRPRRCRPPPRSPPASTTAACGRRPRRPGCRWRSHRRARAW